MIPAKQQAYLEALEIPVWVPRQQAGQLAEFVPARLTLGPGSGDVLMVCTDMSQPSGALASDIARAIRCQPVWAWLSPEGSGMALENAVSERLFTTVLMFGQDLGSCLFNGQIPEIMHSARLVIVPGLEELATKPAQRRDLWATLCKTQLAGTRRLPGQT